MELEIDAVPTLYMIIGHPGTNKIGALMQLLPKETAEVEVFCYETALRNLDKQYHISGDSRVREAIDNLLPEAYEHIDKNVQDGRDIYFTGEGNCSEEVYKLLDYAEGSCRLQMAYVMTDDLDSSFNLSEKQYSNLPLSMKNELNYEFEITTADLRSAIDPIFSRVDIFDGTKDLKHLAKIEKGNVTWALPEIQQKEWMGNNERLLTRIQLQSMVKQKITNSSKKNVDDQNAVQLRNKRKGKRM